MPVRTVCSLVAALAIALIGMNAAVAQSQMDPRNPSCPQDPDWSGYPEMRFSERDMDGRRVLFAEGVIDPGAAERLAAALAEFQGEEVWLRSPGGEARAGNAAGRILRQEGISTRIPSGWTCMGACNFTFMGGIARTVEDGGWFMVSVGSMTFPAAEDHEASPESRRELAQAAALLAAEDSEYLIRMGIARNLLQEVMYADTEDGATRRCLTQDELARYNVTNRAIRVSTPTK